MAATSVETFTFGVYPSALDESFESFVIEVPSTQGEDAAARRAWWQVFHLLGPRGFEPEEFTVCQWRDERLGRLVTAGGLTDYIVGG